MPGAPRPKVRLVYSASEPPPEVLIPRLRAMLADAQKRNAQLAEEVARLNRIIVELKGE